MAYNNLTYFFNLVLMCYFKENKFTFFNGFYKKLEINYGFQPVTHKSRCPNRLS